MMKNGDTIPSLQNASSLQIFGPISYEPLSAIHLFRFVQRLHVRFGCPAPYGIHLVFTIYLTIFLWPLSAGSLFLIAYLLAQSLAPVA